MKNDIKDSVVKSLVKSKGILEVVNEDMTKLTNYKHSIEGIIIDRFEFHNIENGDVKGLRVIDFSSPKKIPLKEILDVFPNTDIKEVLDNVVCDILIDFDKTEENLRFSGKFQDVTIKAIMKQLSKLSKETVKKVEIT
jgi:uncharacterized protein YajQ (UPF0234 family)